MSRPEVPSLTDLVSEPPELNLGLHKSPENKKICNQDLDSSGSNDSFKNSSIDCVELDVSAILPADERGYVSGDEGSFRSESETSFEGDTSCADLTILAGGNSELSQSLETTIEESDLLDGKVRKRRDSLVPSDFRNIKSKNHSSVMKPRKWDRMALHPIEEHEEENNDNRRNILDHRYPTNSDHTEQPPNLDIVVETSGPSGLKPKQSQDFLVPSCSTNSNYHSASPTNEWNEETNDLSELANERPYNEANCDLPSRVLNIQLHIPKELNGRNISITLLNKAFGIEAASEESGYANMNAESNSGDPAVNHAVEAANFEKDVEQADGSSGLQLNETAACLEQTTGGMNFNHDGGIEKPIGAETEDDLHYLNPVVDAEGPSEPSNDTASGVTSLSNSTLDLTFASTSTLPMTSSVSTQSSPVAEAGPSGTARKRSAKARDEPSAKGKRATAAKDKNAGKTGPKRGPTKKPQAPAQQPAKKRGCKQAEPPCKHRCHRSSPAKNKKKRSQCSKAADKSKSKHARKLCSYLDQSSDSDSSEDCRVCGGFLCGSDSDSDSD